MWRYPEPPMPKKIEPKVKPTECRFCGKFPPWDDNDLCVACSGYRDRQGPPNGGRAAGAAFELEEEPRVMAVGR